MRTFAIWCGIGLLALSGSALAQTYPSALPVQGEDQAEFEERLANILEFARPNQVTRFRLPSGRTVSVRSYLPTLVSGGGGPCRGYRVDLSGNGGFMAVDGFRCRDENVNTWRLVEPETVLAQSGNPPVNLNQPPITDQPRSDAEPLYRDDDAPIAPGGVPVDNAGNAVTASTQRVVPVPRRRPTPPSAIAATDNEPVPESAPVVSAEPFASNSADAFARIREEAAPLAAPTAPATPTVQNGASNDPAASASAALSPGAPTGIPVGLTETAERTILSAEPQEGEPAYVTQLRERIERARRLEAEVAGAVREREQATIDATRLAERNTAIITPRDESPDHGAADILTNAPASTIYRTPAAIAPALSDPVQVAVAERDSSEPAPLRPFSAGAARVVGERNAVDPDGYSGDSRIVIALQDLKYLSAGSIPTASAVDSAVDEFATDERFALPIAPDALLTRLSEARERSESLPTCEGDDTKLCLLTQ